MAELIHPDTRRLWAAIEKQNAESYVGDPALGVWPEDPDGGTLRYSNTIRAVLELADEFWASRNYRVVGDLIRERVAETLEVPDGFR